MLRLHDNVYCGYEKIILQVAVMSYSAKFASTFYGPFRCLACLRARQSCVLYIADSFDLKTMEKSSHTWALQHCT